MASDASAYVRSFRNNYSDNAVPNTLAVGLAATDLSLYCPASTLPVGYPSPPFVLRVDYNNSKYEAMLVISGSGVASDPWIVQRGYQGTGTREHLPGAPILHQISAADILGLFDQVARFGIGQPEGAISAPVGTLYIRLDGSPGNSLYLKEGGGATAYGWIAVHVPRNPHRYLTG